MRTWIFAAVLAAMAFAGTTARAEVPSTMQFQGVLADAEGLPLSGEFAMTFTLYASPTEDDAVWAETQTVGVEQGGFAVELGKGDGGALDAAVFAGTPLWLGIQVGVGPELLPRSAIGALPYAVRAAVAENALSPDEILALLGDWGYLTEESDPTVSLLGRTPLSCSAGQIPAWDGSSWVCADDQLGPEGVTYVAAVGRGLELDGVAFGLVSTCGDGEVLSWNQTAMTWDCTAVMDLVTELDPVWAAAAINYYTKADLAQAGKAEVAWGNLIGVPAGFADGTDDGLQTETDPIWGVEKADYFTKINLGTAGEAEISWGNLMEVPAGFSDGTDDGVLVEVDPIWGAAKASYYTKTNLQTSGAAEMHWGNLTNVPAGFADGTDDGLLTELDPVWSAAAASYYTKANLSTDGEAVVAWANLADVPVGFADGTDDGLLVELDPVWSAAAASYYTKANLGTDGEAVVAWANLADVPAGFADGTDDGLLTELDPVWSAAAASYYTKANLSTDGEAVVAWANLADVPVGFADGTDDGLLVELDPVWSAAAASYYTKANLSTDGEAVVAWANLADVPVGFADGTDDGLLVELDPVWSAAAASYYTKANLGTDGEAVVAWANLADVPVGFADGTDDGLLVELDPVWSAAAASYYTKANLSTDGEAVVAWANLADVPVGFADGTDDGLLVELDPVWSAAAASYYTKANLGTGGEAVVAWANLADVPVGFADGTDDGLLVELDPVWSAAAASYYTKTNLQTSGAAAMHWGNLTNVPANLDTDATNDLTTASTFGGVVSGTYGALALVDGVTIAEILDDDGAGSSLDADLLDGQHAASFAAVGHTHAAPAWDDLTGMPAGFADGTDDGLLVELDPVWSAAAASYYTKANLSTDGEAVVAWANLADVPVGFADGTDDGLLVELDPVWSAAAASYYTKANLQTSGAAAMHWGNLTNAPANLDTDATNDLTTASTFGGVVSGTYGALALVDGVTIAEILDDDGAGSSLDADLLDGQHAASFAAVGHTHAAPAWDDLTGMPAGFADGTDDGLLVELDPVWSAAAASYYTKTNLQTSGAAAMHWGNLTSVPAGFADGTDDGLLTELDPVWSAAAASYYTKANLQTSGAAAMHWGNLTNVPAGFADGTDDGLLTELDPVWSAAAASYYTKTNLQTSGAAAMHWGNLTNVPANLDTDATNDLTTASTFGGVVSGTYGALALVDGVTIAEILDDDGAGSSLDADLLDGQHAASFAAVGHTHAAPAWDDLTGMPAGFADGTDDGLLTELDPVWSAAAASYYTKTNLQTSGAAAMHWGNLTNVPAGFADGTDNGLLTELDPVWSAAAASYYTKTNLQTSGAAAMHWGNLTNVPANLDTDATNDLTTASTFGGVVSGTYGALALVDGVTLAEILDDDGPGSELNADFLDGFHGEDFALAGHSHPAQTWDGLAGLPAGFADGVDDSGVEVELDPVWTAVAGSYYTAAQLSTSGASVVHWGNLTGTPVNIDLNSLDDLAASTVFNGAVTGNYFNLSLVDGVCLAEILDDDGAGSGLDADLLDGVHASGFATSSHNHDTAYWKMGGNAGTTPGTHYIGTSDSQALEFKVNGQRAGRLEPQASTGFVGPNVNFGYSANLVATGVQGAVVLGGANDSGQSRRNVVYDNAGAVLGGGSNVAGNVGSTSDAAYATVAGGFFNRAIGYGASIGGGQSNVASGQSAHVAGGEGNAASADFAFTGAGQTNEAGGPNSVVVGGSDNATGGSHSVVVGGLANGTAGDYSMVPGGAYNVASGSYSLAAGLQAKADHSGAFVWADSIGVDLASDAADQFKVRATGGALFQTPATGTRAAFAIENAGAGDALVVQNTGSGRAASITGGEVYISGVCTGNDSCNEDVAEMFFADMGVEAGDVVVIADLAYKRLARSRTAYDSAVIGVVSTNPTMVMGRDETRERMPAGVVEVPLALTGVVPVKVSLEGGPIQVGDFLTASSTPGHAMKATRSGTVVGKALEAFDGTHGSTGSVRILVGLSSIQFAEETEQRFVSLEETLQGMAEQLFGLFQESAALVAFTAQLQVRLDLALAAQKTAQTEIERLKARNLELERRLERLERLVGATQK